MRQIAFILFFFLTLLANAHAEMKFISWDQSIKLMGQGREVVIAAVARVNLKPNYYYSSWSYLFDPSQQIQIIAVKFNGENASYEFQNNKLNIHFKEIYDGAQAAFQIEYVETQALQPFYRQDWIQLPSWIAGTTANVSVELPEKYLLCSLNPEFQKNDQVLKWQGIVPKGGFKSLFKSTPSNARFKIEIENSFTGTLPYGKLQMAYPVYFNFPSQTVSNYQVLPGVIPTTLNIEGLYHVLSFENAGVRQIITPILGEIQTTPLDGILNEDPQKNLSYPGNQKITLDKVIKRIHHQPNPYQLPEYVRIGQWVNQYLKYDISLTGKKLSNLELLRNPRGVCAHYAQLYQTLLRYRGIPAFTVSGYAFNNAPRSGGVVDTSGAPGGGNVGWDAHAWVVLYIEGRWIQVDPTWGLFSGNLPASHLYFYRNGLNQSGYQAINYHGQTQMKTKVTIQNL